MTLSVWRLSHLTLAIFSFLFILMASVTGAILSFDPINEKMLPYKATNFDEITLAQSIPVLREKHSEILELNVDHNDFVVLEGFDEEGNDFKKIIDPLTGNFLADPLEKSAFIQWITTLHRSMFLHETGRFVVGFVSFLLLLITISGTILIIKRQNGVKHFFSKVTKDFLAQYYHVVAGRLLLIPILIIALTGTYLFMLRFEVISTPEIEIASAEPTDLDDAEVKNPKDFSAFQNIYLKDIQKIEFPFDEDPAEFYKIKTAEKEFSIDQYSGKVVNEVVYPKTKILETLSLDLHTGRTSGWWSLILGIASINILFFIWSGFVITFNRTRTKVAKNKIKAEDAKYVVLVGSENGTTLGFANKIHEQLLAEGKASHITQLNQYQSYPKATHLLVFASTYGIGDAPTNAKKFESLVQKFEQNTAIQFAVVGFGSRAYTEFCGYAIKVHHLLSQKFQKEAVVDLKLINDRSPGEFALWTKDLNIALGSNFSTTPANYVGEQPKLKTLEVVESTQVTNEDATFTVTLSSKNKFESGDLLAIYPSNDHRERLYSIGKVNGKIQLVVKLHEMGLGSQFLYQLKASERIQARIVKNKNFHFPKKTKEVICIANGTGIAPFLGMINNNFAHVSLRIYAGFRFNNATTQSYESMFEQAIQSKKLTNYQLAFSREDNKQYVMDLIRKDAYTIAQSLQNGSVFMICGALAMQYDVEKVLETICQEHLNQSFESYKNNGQFLTDCY